MQEIIDRVTRLYDEDVAAQRKAVTKADIPLTYGAITIEWLTDVLCGDTAGARVTAFTFDGDDEGTTSRRRIHVRYNAAGDKAGLPGTIFCKSAQTLWSRLTLGIMDGTRAENAFYKLVRPQLDIEAPVALWANYDPKSLASILVLEDLSSKVVFCDDRTDVSWDQAVAMVTAIAKLHSRFYEHPDLRGPSLPFRTLPELYELTRLVGMDESEPTCFLMAEDVMPERFFRRKDEILGATYRSMEVQKTLPRTLLHSDCHIKNWYLTNDGAMGLADWQILSVGHWSHDLAYALSSSLSIENRRLWERELIQIYLDAMSARGAPAVSFDAAWLRYRQQLFIALRFWTVALKPSDMLSHDIHPRDTSLALIGRIAHAMDDLDSLDSLP
jgi:thiamine kinase-like enzyme